MVTSRDGTGIRWHHAGDGPPAVLVHGTSADRGNWIACTPHLSGQLSLYAIEREYEIPGQGHLAQAFAPELFCAEVLRGIDQT